MGETKKIDYTYESLRDKLSTDPNLELFIKMMEEKDEQIKSLQKRMTVLENSNSLLKRRVDDLMTKGKHYIVRKTDDKPEISDGSTEESHDEGKVDVKVKEFVNGRDVEEYAEIEKMETGNGDRIVLIDKDGNVIQPLCV